MIALTICQTRTRLSGQMGVAACLRDFWASLIPWAVLRVSK